MTKCVSKNSHCVRGHGPRMLKLELVQDIIILNICVKQNQNRPINKASQAIQSPRPVLFFLLIALLDVFSFVHVNGIVAFKH